VFSVILLAGVFYIASSAHSAKPSCRTGRSGSREPSKDQFLANMSHELRTPLHASSATPTWRAAASCRTVATRGACHDRQQWPVPALADQRSARSVAHPLRSLELNPAPVQIAALLEK